MTSMARRASREEWEVDLETLQDSQIHSTFSKLFLDKEWEEERLMGDQIETDHSKEMTKGSKGPGKAGISF